MGVTFGPHRSNSMPCTAETTEFVRPRTETGKLSS